MPRPWRSWAYNSPGTGWRASRPPVGAHARRADQSIREEDAAVIDDFDRRIAEQIPHLRRYAVALLGDRDRAEDLVQDCLERAWSRFHLWRPGNLRGWLFTIMHNLSVNARRRQFRAPPTMPLEDDSVIATRATQEDRLAVGALQQALERLPEEQRAVVLLVGLEEFSYAEAAKILGIPMGTVMSRLHRGREQLRRLLAGNAEPTLRRIK